MKTVICILSFLFFAVAAFGQCPADNPTPFTPPPGKSFNTPKTVPQFRSIPSTPAPTAGSELPPARTQEELDFLANGPKLFTMDKALQVSALTGKPVVCWVGPNIFANEKARKTSAALGDTTIQAVMVNDGTRTDDYGNPLPPLRVKFSSSNYDGNKDTRFIPVEKLNDKAATAILRFVRGAAK